MPNDVTQRAVRDWKNEFFDALFPIDERVLSIPYSLKRPSNKHQFLDIILPDRKKTNVELAFQLLNDNIPKSLYKYRAVSKYSLDNFENDTIWVDNPAAYNDPFDGVSIENGDVISGLKDIKDSITDDPAYKKFLSDLYTEEFVRELRESFDAAYTTHAQHTFTIACLSETKSSVLMWSHYADDHKGFCIRYSGPEIYHSEEVDKHLFPVKYLARKDSQIPISALALDYPGLYSVLCKTRDWRYEKEWRICFGIEYGMKPRNIHMPKAKGVYLGARMIEDNIKKVLEIATMKRIPAYKEILDNTNRKIRFQKIQ